MTIEDKVKWLDELLVHLNTCRDAYGQSLEQIKESANDPPGKSLEDFFQRNWLRLISTWQFLEQAAIAARMERSRLLEPAPAAEGVRS